MPKVVSHSCFLFLPICAPTTHAVARDFCVLRAACLVLIDSSLRELTMSVCVFVYVGVVECGTTRFLRNYKHFSTREKEGT